MFSEGRAVFEGEACPEMTLLGSPVSKNLHSHTIDLHWELRPEGNLFCCCLAFDIAQIHFI